MIFLPRSDHYGSLALTVFEASSNLSVPGAGPPTAAGEHAVVGSAPRSDRLSRGPRRRAQRAGDDDDARNKPQEQSNRVRRTKYHAY